MHQALYTKSFYYTTKMDILQTQLNKESNVLSKQALKIVSEWIVGFKTELEEDRGTQEFHRDQVIVFKNKCENNCYRSTDQGERDILLQKIHDYDQILWRYAGNILQIEEEINEIDQLVASINIAVE